MKTFENFILESKGEQIFTVIPMMKSNATLIDVDGVKSFKKEKDASDYHKQVGGYIASNQIL